MSEEHSPSYFADENVNPFGEESLSFLGNNDSNADIPFSGNFDAVEAQEYLANVDLTRFRYPEPIPTQPAEGSGNPSPINADGMDSGSGSAKVLKDSSNGTTLPAPQVFGNGDPSNTVSAETSSEHGQAPTGQSNAGDALADDEDQFWNDHEQLSNFQNSGQAQFQMDFNEEDWKNIEDIVANGDFSDFPNPISIGQEPYAQGNVEDSLNPTQHPVNSQQWSPITTPAMDAFYGTPMPPTQNGLGISVGNSSTSNREGPSDYVVPAAHPFREEGSAASVEAEAENFSDDEDEEEEEEDLPDQIAFETYNENDPLIVQNPRQRGWGRTGTRDGQEVWFNPRSLRWRKLQPLQPP